MGCAVGLLSTYDVQDIDQEIGNLVPHLPMAELMNGGIIKLEGANGFFNPNSLLDPSWLKGRMTVEQYRQAIEYINKCAGHSQIGLSKMYNTSERTARLNMKTQAGMRAVEEINKSHPGMHWTYQVTAQNLQMNVSWELQPEQRLMQGGRRPIGRSTLTNLYITLQ